MYSFHFALSKIQQGKFCKGVFRAVNFNLNEQDLFWKKREKCQLLHKILHVCLLFFFISVLNNPVNGKYLLSKGTNEELDTSKVKYWATEKNKMYVWMLWAILFHSSDTCVRIGKSIVTRELVLFSIVYIGC